MARCCCICSSFGCCCCSSSEPKAKLKPRPTPKHITLKRFHNCCLWITQIIGSAILIALTLWQVVRNPEPTVWLTRFEIEAIANNGTNPNSTLIHYDIALHNTDMYKSIHYDVLILRATYSYTTYGFVVNMDETGKGLHQGRGEITHLRNNTADNLYFSLQGWPNGWSTDLLTVRQYIHVRFIMGINYRAFNRVIATRQSTREVDVYFNQSDGSALINPPFGVKLK